MASPSPAPGPAVAPARRDDALGLYVHLPWCVEKCPYCDFNSHALRGAPLPAKRYVDAVLADLADQHRGRAAAGDERRITSLFFGGGTPSLFPAREIARILAAVDAAFGLATGAEITLEANPGAVEHGRFAELADAGVNRLSLGAQSFDDAALAALGRIHGARDIFTAFDEARAAGFSNLNVDLMYALPGQTLAGAQADLRQLIALGPEHISHYQLTLEPNTLFHAQPPALPDTEAAYAMQEACQILLTQAGYDQYEVSAYARTDRHSRHNLNYWRFGDYLGVGAGAHGKLTDPGAGVMRSTRTKHPRRYMADAAAAHDTRILSAADLAFEYPLNVLRLRNAPLCGEDFAARTGVPAAAIATAAAAAAARGLLAPVAPGRWQKTDLGWRFLNDLQAMFLTG